MNSQSKYGFPFGVSYAPQSGSSDPDHGTESDPLFRGKEKGRLRSVFCQIFRFCRMIVPDFSGFAVFHGTNPLIALSMPP